MTPDELPKLFAAAFGKGDAATIAGWLAADADVVTLTGGLAEGVQEARAILEGEFAGIFAQAKLVTGKTRIRNLGPGAAILTQRYVIAGARDEAGQDLPRIGCQLTAMLINSRDGWRAVNWALVAV